jgi:dihydropteroate synthase
MADGLIDEQLRTHLGLARRPRWHPYLMGVVNATPDSFSDLPGEKSVGDRVRRADELIAAGADIIDIGGESGVTNKPPLTAAEEIARVVPVVEAVAALEGAVVSVDTYKPAVARAALAAGARIVNDVSGLADEELAEAAAESGAALVVMHTRAAPKQKDFPEYADVVADVCSFLADRVELAIARGVPAEHVIVDPGPDFAKTPAETVAVMRGLDRVAEIGRPILLAVGRKDFIGALTGRGPREREAGTLAALAAGTESGAAFARVHDVAAAVDFLTVRAALTGELVVDPQLRLPGALRRVD